MKLKHLESYSLGLDLEEFKGFILNILRWLKMNNLLGLTRTEMKVSYMGTCITGKALEWFRTFRSPGPILDLGDAQGLQKIFLHTCK
jgi:hypothetical protein